MNNYKNAKSLLNKEQLEAVESIEGPVLVIAGPGTGKTQVLTLRIAEIIEKTDTNPNQILCLTFTEAGVIAMRERLQSFIGQDAYSVFISTFHGFCTEIISLFPEKFLFSSSLSTADELEKTLIIKEILEKNKFEFLKPFSANLFFLKDIISKISTLKREGINPEGFLKIITTEKEEFDNIDDEKKYNKRTGKIKIKYANIEKNINKWLELQKIYELYQLKMKQKGLIDFDDQIIFVINELNKKGEVLQYLQEKYLYIMSDEFQDSNGSQVKILDLLTHNIEKPNIFTVGDDDQSIYRFQGASLENIVNFLDNYKTKIISLVRNYRSTEQILDVAKNSIKNNQERLANKLNFDKKIFSPLNKQGEVFFNEFQTAEEEILSIINKIKDTENKSEIAILTRTNKEAYIVADYLNKQNIDANFSSSNNILESNIIKKIIKIIELINNPYNDENMFAFLNFDILEIESVDLWKLWRKIRQENKKFFDFYSEFKEENHNENEKKIFDKINIIYNLNKKSYNTGFITIIEEVFKEFNLLDFLLKNSIEDIDNISVFFDEIKNLSKGKSFSISGFLESIEIRQEFNIPISVKNKNHNKGIIVLTVHGSKGLEYETVFVINIANQVWGDRRNIDKISLPKKILSVENTEDKNEEERRLFFVAITRAKQNLYLSSNKISFFNKEQQKSRFICELEDDLKTTENYKQISSIDKLQNKIQIKKEENINIKTFVKTIIEDENFAISPTSLENYFVCPRKFLYDNLLKLPRKKEKKASLGTAIHKALEIFFINFIKQNNPPSFELAIKTFDYHLENHEILTKEELEDCKNEGKKIVSQYLEFYKNDFICPVKTEFNFKSHNVFLEDVPITGMIDKIEFLNKEKNTVKIIDYKIKKYVSDNTIMGNTKMQNIYSGSIYRQLMFYKLLCDEDKKFKYNAEIFSIDFVYPDEKGVFKKSDFVINEDDLQNFKENIIKVWQDIKNVDFLDVNKKCKIQETTKEKCEYCERYSKNM